MNITCLSFLKLVCTRVCNPASACVFVCACVCMNMCLYCVFIYMFLRYVCVYTICSDCVHVIARC